MQNETLNAAYRPKCLGDISGQNITTSIIAKQISSGKVASVYLFVGPAGTGKTSLARVMANELNCVPIEINAAVFNTVSDVKDLNKDASYMKLGQERNFYIIDEIQNYRKDAISAMLKLLEEPPEQTTFVLCTTELQKIPKTILSRAQVFYFTAIKSEVIAERLSHICEDAGLEFESEALELIADSSFGCMRDAVQKLDQVSSLGEITKKNVIEVVPNYNILEDVLIDRKLEKLSSLNYSSITADTLISKAIALSLEDRFNPQIAMGLVKMRPFLTYADTMETIQLYLKEAFKKWPQ